ncbi:YkvA family protein [Mariniphaga sediminis]|uniref:YkvA family protein n=1 Tax=Mariniphaga sediminis TaxID=1628158 RepID=UPI003569DC54
MNKNQFVKYFSEESLWEKIKQFSKSAGVKVVYAVLLLYYVMNDKRVSLKTKLSIAAALGYFILPTDAIFDLTPLIGYSDDLGVLLFALTQVSSNITPEIKEKARKKLTDWFGEIKEEELRDLEDKIG